MHLCVKSKQRKPRRERRERRHRRGLLCRLSSLRFGRRRRADTPSEDLADLIAAW
jgi:hypothetical protein